MTDLDELIPKERPEEGLSSGLSSFSLRETGAGYTLGAGRLLELVGYWNWSGTGSMLYQCHQVPNVTKDNNQPLEIEKVQRSIQTSLFKTPSEHPGFNGHTRRNKIAVETAQAMLHGGGPLGLGGFPLRRLYSYKCIAEQLLRRIRLHFHVVPVEYSQIPCPLVNSSERR